MMKRVTCGCSMEPESGNKEHGTAKIKWCDSHKNGFPTKQEAEEHAINLAKDFIDSLEKNG